MRTVKLSPRLSAVSEFVRQDSVIADIGTDHGLLITYLAQNKIIKKGYACDINASPLESAKANINEYKVNDIVETMLTDGLIGLDNKGITDITIAGMGGELIIDIIDNADWLKIDGINMVFQAMTKDYILREKLYERGFYIIDEKAVVDGNFVYSVLRVGYDGVEEEIPLRFAWSGLIWDKTDPDSEAYLKFRHNALERMRPSFDKKNGYQKLYDEFTERLMR